MWIDEARVYLKLNEGCILKYKLSSRVVINSCLNLNELIYSCRWKLAVIDFLHTVGSPLARSRIAVWLVNMTVGLIFQIVGSPFMSRGYPSLLVAISEPFIIFVGLPFRSRGYWLISVSRLSNLSDRRLGPETNLQFCLISASYLSKLLDRRFPQKLLQWTILQDDCFDSKSL